MKTDKKLKQYLPFIVGYLGKSTYVQVADFLNKAGEAVSATETFNALEKLVQKGKINSETVSGEIKYTPKYLNTEVEENA